MPCVGDLEGAKRRLRLRTVPRWLAGALLASIGVVVPCGAIDDHCLLQTSVLNEAQLELQASQQNHGFFDQDNVPCGVVPTAQPCIPMSFSVESLPNVTNITPKALMHTTNTTDTTEIIHKVEHVSILNKAGIWLLMFVLIIVMAAAVARMDMEVDAADDTSDKSSTFQRWKPHLHMLMTSVALCVTGVCWGIAQEYITTTEYTRDGVPPERMPSFVFLLLANRIFTAVSLLIALKMSGAGIYFKGAWLCCVPSLTNSISSWLGYTSLLYVTFPLQSATKSAKLLPVMMISTFRGKPQKVTDYIEALVIIVAIAVFAFEVEGSEHDVNTNLKIVGVVMLVLILFLDATTPHMQDEILSRHPELTVMQMSFIMSCIAGVILFITLCAKGELIESFRFFSHFPMAWLHLLVLNICSTLQYTLIPYTIKYFGPVVSVVMITVRQMISSYLSAAIFDHHISALAWLAASLFFSIVILRALRPLDKVKSQAPPPPESETTAGEQERDRVNSNGNVDGDAITRTPSGNPIRRTPSVVKFLRSLNTWNVVICMVGMHVPLALYSIAQEFMSVHLWDGDLFKYSMFLIAMNRTFASLFAILILKSQGMSVFTSRLFYAVIPAVFNLSATYCQYRALNFLAFPLQTLIKNLKVVPVMLCGRAIGIRTYTMQDYIEAIVISLMVAFFAWNFQRSQREYMGEDTGHLVAGIILMLGYVCCDSVTSNSEDFLYQRFKMDPAHMVLGMQFSSGLFSWGILACDTQLVGAIRFISSHEQVLVPIVVLAAAEAAGCYACTTTVRLFGPAAFTLILMSHQTVSLLVSVLCFSHPTTILCGVCLALVAVVTLVAAARHALRTASIGPLLRSAGANNSGSAQSNEFLKGPRASLHC